MHGDRKRPAARYAYPKKLTIKKEPTMTQIKKVLYTAKIHTTGGRESGVSRSSDGRLDDKLSTPDASGTGTNPRAAFGRRLVGLLRIVDQDRGRQNESHATD
jgi:hypothetical protein